MTVVVAKADAKKQSRFLGTTEIPLAHLHPHPKNPRKNYHFSTDNPKILAMADSLVVAGQQNQLKVYEDPHNAGHFIVLQGHRRLFAAQHIGLDSLECTIVKAPATVAEELDWIGSEDSLKEDWGAYTRLEFARSWAQAWNIKLTSPQIQAKTGLSPARLVTAEKMFNLQPLVVAHVARWEEHQYFSQVAEQNHLLPDFPTRTGIKITDFSPEKAAFTWDIFASLRANCSDIVNHLDDLELQTRIAQIASRSTAKELQSLKVMIDTMGRSPRPGQLAQLTTLMEGNINGHVDISALVRTTRNSYLTKLLNATKLARRTAEAASVLVKNVDQLGSDIDTLSEANAALLSVLRHCDKLQSELEKKIAPIAKQRYER